MIRQFYFTHTWDSSRWCHSVMAMKRYSTFIKALGLEPYQIVLSYIQDTRFRGGFTPLPSCSQCICPPTTSRLSYSLEGVLPLGKDEVSISTARPHYSWLLLESNYLLLFISLNVEAKNILWDPSPKTRYPEYDIKLHQMMRLLLSSYG